MAFYLVLASTLGSIHGIYARQFVKDEIVEFDDPDLAAVGLRDGWLQESDGAPAPETPDLADYVVLLPKDLPGTEAGWSVDVPEVGVVISLAEEVAAPLVESGVVALPDSPEGVAAVAALAEAVAAAKAAEKAAKKAEATAAKAGKKGGSNEQS